MIGCLHFPFLSKDVQGCNVSKVLSCSAASGPCFLAYGVSKTHPLKGTGRNEDAFFFTKDMIGVADGVGGVADELPGVCPGDLPNELMQRCKDMSVLRQLEPEKFLEESQEILGEHGVKVDDLDESQWTSYVLMRSWLNCQNWGATTSLVVAIEDGMVTASQHGDSVFMHLRKRGKSGWEILYRSEPQVHSFLCPYQLMRKPLKGMDDYAAADVQWRPDLFHSPPPRKVKAGDFIIAGSDGLFDNVYDHEIVDTIAMHESIDSRCAQEIANELFFMASEAAGSKTKKTPFADAAEAEYKQWGKEACGGRPDDITVVVAYVGDEDDESDDIVE